MQNYEYDAPNSKFKILFKLPDSKFKIQIAMDEEQIKQKLTPGQYKILREKGTEAPFTRKYVHKGADGTYMCMVCNNPLFSSMPNLILVRPHNPNLFISRCQQFSKITRRSEEA